MLSNSSKGDGSGGPQNKQSGFAKLIQGMAATTGGSGAPLGEGNTSQSSGKLRSKQTIS